MQAMHMEVYSGQNYVEKIVCEGKSTKVAHHHLSQTDSMFLLTRHISRPQVSYKILETGACRIFETPSIVGGSPLCQFPTIFIQPGWSESDCKGIFSLM